MTQTSRPFGVPPGDVMDELTWCDMQRYVRATGIEAVSFQNALNQLAVTPSLGRSVNVDTGAAGVQGHQYESDEITNLTFEANTNPAGTRADLVVLECKWGDGAGITLQVVQGVAGAVWPAGLGSLTNTPKPATLVQEYGTKWQIGIAQVNVAYNTVGPFATTDIIDMRNFIHSNTAKSSTIVIAADNASPLMRANADVQIPAGYLHADELINAAILLLYTTYGGGTVKLSEGLFKSGNSVIGKQDVDLVGQGSKTVIQLQATAGAVPVIYLNGESNVTVRNLSIDGGGTAFTPYTPQAIVAGADGIRVDNGANVRLRNLQISNCGNFGININTLVSIDTSYGHRISGCKISGNYAGGINTSGNAGHYLHNQIFNNLKGILVTGVNTTLGAMLNTIKGNIIRTNSQGGLYLSGLTGYQVLRNLIGPNMIAGNCIQADNAYPQVTLYGTACLKNFLKGNMVTTAASSYSYLPSYGIYLDTTVSANTVMQNECIEGAKTTAHNIGCGRAASSNINPNWIRFNHSGSVAPDASSYDA